MSEHSDKPAAAAKKSDLPVRALSGVVMITVAALALWFGGIPFWLLATVGSVFMMAEWADLHKIAPKQKRLAQYALFVALAVMCPLAWGAHWFALGVLAGAAFFIVIVTGKRELALGTLYCGLPVFALLVMRRQPDWGVVYTVWAMALVWCTDIGAYFAGRGIGGPKLWPAVSPNKTWAGLIGGVLAATAWSAFVHFEYGLPLRLTLAAPVLAVLAQGGDLFESALKRRAGVKDSGNVLPGHGGVMDRLDGLVPVAPLAALLVVAPDLLGTFWP